MQNPQDSLSVAASTVADALVGSQFIGTSLGNQLQGSGGLYQSCVQHKDPFVQTQNMQNPSSDQQALFAHTFQMFAAAVAARNLANGNNDPEAMVHNTCSTVNPGDFDCVNPGLPGNLPLAPSIMLDHMQVSFIVLQLHLLDLIKLFLKTNI